MKLGKESEIVEFKESIAELDTALKDVCAMLNKHGNGKIYFGVKNNGDICGQQVGNNTQRKIVDKISESIEPKIFPTINENNGIIVVEFNGENKPYAYKGIHYIRVGEESRIMSEEELVKFIRDMFYANAWEDILTKYTINNIDNEALEKFYKRAIDSNRLDFKDYDIKKLLIYLGLCNDMILNNAGYYLFGKNVDLNLKLAIYATDDKTTCIDLKEIKNNIFNMVDSALSYIYQNIKWQARITDHERMDIPEIPEQAIREIIINSFAHAQYESNTEHAINIYRDRIEIYNPGVFPNNCTPLDYVNGDLQSIIRNKKILDVLFRSKDVEKGGSGFKKVYSLCKQEDIKVDYRTLETGFTFIFYRKNVVKDLDIVTHSNLANFTHGELSNFTFDDLKSIDTIILKLIQKNRKVKRKELAEKIGKSEKTVQRALLRLEANGSIKRASDGRNPFWEVVL